MTAKFNYPHKKGQKRSFAPVLTALNEAVLLPSAFILMWAVFCLALPAAETPPAPAPPPPLPGLDAAPPKKKEETLPEVDWSAVKQSFVEEKGLVILTGSAWVRYKGMKLEADHIVFYRLTREVYAEGNIRLRAGESEMDAQAAYMDIDHDTGYMVDAVVRVSSKTDRSKKTGLEAGGAAKKGRTEKRPERDLEPVQTATSFIRARDPYGIYLLPADDPQARTNLMFKAARLVKKSSRLYTAEDAFVTTDDMVHPMYGVKASQVELHMITEAEAAKIRPPRRKEGKAAEPEKPGQALVPSKIVARGARTNIMGFSLFPFPTITYDLVKGYPFFQVNAGKSSRFGQYVMNRFGYYFGSGEERLFDPTRVYLDLDERYARGPGMGFELDWETGRRPPENAADRGGLTGLERGEGRLRAYSVDEFQISEDDELRRARRDFERRLQPKTDGFPRRQYDANLLFAQRRKADDAGPPSFGLNEERDQLRGMVDFQQHQPLQRFAGIDNLLLDFRYERQTDRDFMLEYFQRNYQVDNQPEALASVRKPGDNYSIELLYRARPQDFDGSPPRSPLNFGAFTGSEPGLTYSLAPTPLPYGTYLTAEAQAARMTREFDRMLYDQPGFETGRGYAKMDLARPVQWGPVNIVPHLGTQQQGYTDSRDLSSLGDNSGNGGAISQGAVTWGLDVTSRIYGTFPDLENDELGLKGLHHIIEPRLSYSGVSNTRTDPVRLLDFDQIDDLTKVNKVTLAVDQTFQTKHTTKDGEVRSVNFAGFDMAMDYFPTDSDQDRLLHGDNADLFHMDGFLRVMDLFKIDAGLGIEPTSCKTETASYGLTIDPRGRWRVKLEERFNYTDRTMAIAGSDQYRVRFEFQASERWSLAYEQVYELRTSLLVRQGKQIERISVTRNYGALDASFTYSIDKNFGDHALMVSVLPVASYRNVVVPSQDLLVAAGEVSGEETEAPEERNFDPFELLKARGKKKAGTGPKGAPKAPARDQNVPAPPPPAPDKADSGLFLDPNAPPQPSVAKNAKQPSRPARPAKVDEDDWTTPPATPASTR